MGVVSHPSRSAGQLPAWRYWLHRLVPRVELTPGRIAATYAVFGMVALFGSDVLLVRYVTDPLLAQLQALKGGVEVVVSAGLVYVLVDRRETQLRRTMAELDQHQQELDVLHRVLRHNLRNDLNVLLGVAERLHGRESTDREGRAGERLRDISRGILQYTEQANRIRGITERDGRAHTFDAAAVAAEVVERYSAAYPDAELTATLPDRAPVEANAMFPGALEELVENAIEHNDSAAPTVEVVVDREDGPAHMTTIRVVDDGPQIPDAELEPLRRGAEGQVLHLSGMGLWFVTWTVRHSDGEIDFETLDGRGTAVTVGLRRAPEALDDRLAPLNAD